MAVEFRCQRCGKLVGITGNPAGRIQCPACKGRVQVPPVLASLPQPLVPGDASPAAAIATGAQGEHLVYEQHDPVMALMARVMPWVISLFFHAGALVIMAFLTIMVIKGAVAPAEVVPPRIDIPGAAGVPTLKPGAGGNSDLRPRSDNRNGNEYGWARISSPVSALGPNVGTDDLGTTKGTVSLHGIAGTSGIAVSGGPGDAGDPAPFGLAVRAGERGGPRGRIFEPVQGQVNHVVYVVDRSGSMLDTFDDVRKELKNSIYWLGEKQTFHVIFFSSGALTENPPKRLVKADREAKRLATEFLNGVRPVSQTDPIPAIKRAFEVLAQAPTKEGKVIYLLTDGEFPDNDAALKTFRALNADKGVHVNTILHRYKIESMMKLLQQIADENKGTFKFVEVAE